MEKLAKIIIFGIVLFLVYYFLPLFLPFLIALLIVVLFEPMTSKLTEFFKGRRVPAVLVVFTGFFVGSFLVIYTLLSVLIREILVLAKKVPDYFNNLSENNQNIYEIYKNLPEERKMYINESITSLVERLTSLVSQNLGNFMSIISSFPNYFIAFIIFIIAVYIMGIEQPRLKSTFLKFFTEGETTEKMTIVIDKLKHAVVGFLRAQVILSALTYIVSLVGLWIIGLPYIFIISLFIVIVDLLPILGTGSALVPWATYLFITGDIYEGVGLIVLFLFITLFRKAIEPKLLGDTIGLKPLSTLISLYIGYAVFGILGMLIAPLVVIVINALEEADLITIKITL